MSLIARVRAFVAEHDLLRPDTRVVAAVSGGSDSMALALVLAELERRREVRLAGLVHVNHQLRPSADADEQFVHGVAADLGKPIVSHRVDVRQRARDERRSIEAAARAARLDAFERARLELGADAIAVGHTKDDQAETVLLRLIRGAGPRGLSGMHPRTGTVVRPLLDCRRADLRDWLLARGARFVDDETNADVSIPRNRVRAELLPLIAARFNPGIVDVLAGEAVLARELWRWLEEEARAFGDAAELDAQRLRRANPALRRLVVWRALTAAAGGRPISFDHVTAALRLIDGEGGSIDVPGVRMHRIGSRVVLTTRPGSRGSGGSLGSQGSMGSLGSQGSMGSQGSVGSPGSQGSPNPNTTNTENLANPTSLENLANPTNLENLANPTNLENLANPTNLENLPNPANPANLYWYPLSIPGEVVVAEAGCVVSVEPRGGVTVDQLSATVGRSATAFVRGDLIAGSLAVRNRRPGDRYRPLGLHGSKKLQDVFVDRKVARHERDAVPLVVDERDRIVWVAGHGIDEAFRVTDASQAVLVLRLTRA
jgi:tRNA(Ile)-lysidine synthetase-like protein